MKSLYLTAILPPDDITTQIDEIRKECAATFNAKAALKPPVHITLFRPLKLDEERENELLTLLESVKQAHEPFEIELKDFDIFRRHVLYINVVKNEALGHLAHHIRDEYLEHSFAAAEASDQKEFHPHITIAFRDISPAIFPKLWAAYKDRIYTSKFRVEKFTLLKHDSAKWLPYRTYSLTR